MCIHIDSNTSNGACFSVNIVAFYTHGTEKYTEAKTEETSFQ